MNDDPRTHLYEWNRLARENAENAIVSSMFESALKASEPIDTFSTWLLLGTAAIASFIITNADKVGTFFSHPGFTTCGSLLCLSCLFGLISKIYALRCKIHKETGEATRRIFAEHLATHEKKEADIKEAAEKHGVTLETGIRLERVLTEFLAPLPKITAWLAMRQLNKNSGNPQMGYLPAITSLQRQGLFALLQSLSFLGFLIAGVIFAASR